MHARARPPGSIPQVICRSSKEEIDADANDYVCMPVDEDSKDTNVDLEVEDVAGDRPDVKVRKQPVTPSWQEVQDHNATHYPYRDWCPYCVAGQGRRDKHSSVSSNYT